MGTEVPADCPVSTWVASFSGDFSVGDHIALVKAIEHCADRAFELSFGFTQRFRADQREAIRL